MECSRTQKDRKHWVRRYRRTKSNIDKIELNKATAKARYVKRNARKESWQAYVSTINCNTPMSKVWKKVRKMSGKYNRGAPPCIQINGILEMDHKKVADALGRNIEYISSTPHYDQEFRTIKEAKENKRLNFTATEQYDYNDFIQANEIKTALKTCKNTAPGEDNVHYIMIRNLADSATKLLLHIYNKVYIEHLFPDKWSRAILLPFLKPNKNPRLVNSYRPIALTSCLCKILEKVINLRLMYFLERHNFLSKFQIGFRKMRSTVDALARIETDILNAFKNRKHLVAIFFYIEKAYDTTWKYKILETIHRYGLRGALPHFIKNFMENRIFQVKVANKLSNEYIQEEGVPQGSVLSVTLFIIAINDIIEYIPEDITKSLYVDDLVIYYAATNTNHIERKLQLTINKIASWAKHNGYKLSIDKTVAVHFHRMRGLPYEPNFNLNNNRIIFEKSTKFLGMILDQRLRWAEHINYIKDKAMQKLNILKCLSHTNWGADRETLLRLYRSLIRSKLDYGSHIYATASAHILTKLNAVHHQAIRLCTGAFKSSPVTSLCAEAAEPPLEYRRWQLGLQHYVRMQRLADCSYYANILNNESHHLYAENDDKAPIDIRMHHIANKMQLTNFRVLPCQYPLEPQWRLSETVVCCDPIISSEKDYNPDVLKLIYTEHIDEAHADSMQVFTDGSKNQNGTGCAYVLNNEENSFKLKKHSSIFTAELYSIFKVLQCIENVHNRNFTNVTDSKSSIQAIQNINNSHSKVSKIQSWLIMMQARHKTVKFCCVSSHINIAGNERADRLAKEVAIAEGDIALVHYPYKDFIQL